MHTANIQTHFQNEFVTNGELRIPTTNERLENFIFVKQMIIIGGVNKKEY